MLGVADVSIDGALGDANEGNHKSMSRCKLLSPIFVRGRLRRSEEARVGELRRYMSRSKRVDVACARVFGSV